jgi:hypothetical protein
LERRPLRDILAVAAGSFATLLALDCAAFRTGFYERLLSPDSYAGRFRRAEQIGSQTPPASAKPVLLLGNSIVGEGFSERIADGLADGRVRFINAAIPGSSLRSWFFLLRELDPRHDGYSVIVIPLEDYDDEDGPWDRDDELVDLRVIEPALRLTDLAVFPWSFRKWSARGQAFQATFLKGTIYRDDLRELLRNPRERLAAVRLSGQGAREWAYAYDGQSQVFNNIDPEFQAMIRRQPSPQTGHYKEHRTYWLGRLMAPYQAGATRFLFFRVPRNPLPVPRYGRFDPLSSIRGLAGRPRVLVADEKMFDYLEQPKYFFDGFHLNSSGRRLFSHDLGTFVLQRFF